MKPPLHRPLVRSLLACALIAAWPVAPAHAQTANATVRGQLSASAGTEVVATDLATGAIRRTHLGPQGSFSLVGLPPGTYRVEAAGRSRTVVLSVAATLNVDLDEAEAPDPGAGATTLDRITVNAPALLEEVRSPEVGQTVSLRQIQTTPQVSRNFLEFADAVPGMVFTRDGDGRTSLRGGAQNGSSINVYIDGVGQKSYVRSGGVAGQFFSAGNPFSQLAIGEYKVITSNYKAEYGQISSAAVTSVTKSGTNEFHGEAFYRYTNERLRARTPAERQPGRDKVVSAEKEYGFSLGGPIVRDRAHFFLAYEAKRFTLPATVGPTGVALKAVDSLPAQAAAELGPASQPFQQNLVFAKIDVEPTDRDRIELSLQDRQEKQYGFGGVNARSHSSFTDNYDTRWALRWAHSGDIWFNEVLATREDSFNNPTPLTLGNGLLYTTPDGINDPDVLQIGGGSPLSAQRKGQKGWSIEDNLTLSGLQWQGEHTIKMGVRYKRIDLYAADASDVNPQFSYTLENPVFPAATPYRAFFTKPVVGIGGLTPSVRSAAQQLGIYLQDDWQVNDHLQLNLGVRWDQEKNPSYLGFVTPPNVIAALGRQDPNGPPGQTYQQSLALGGVNIGDYIGTGSNRSAFKGARQPRLGFSYDLNADEQHVIHGGAGRSYDRDLFDYLQLERTKAALPQITVNFADPATGGCYRGAAPCYPWNPDLLNGLVKLQALVGPTSNSGAEVDMLNNKLKAPYSDQFSLGMRNRIGDWSTDVTLTRVLSYGGFAYTLGNRYPNGNFFDRPQLCNSTSKDRYGAAWGCGLPGFGSLILGNNGIRTRSTQLLVSAQKPYTRESGWGMSVAYTLTHARQNRDINEHYSFDMPTIQQYPFIRSNAAARHRLVVTGNYDGPWGITFGAKLTLATPITATTSYCPETLPAGGSNQPSCRQVGITPNGNGRFLLGGPIFGYRSIDVQATKAFKLHGNTSMYARMDIINLLSFDNLVDLNMGNWQGQRHAWYNRAGGITGTPRQVKLEVGLKF
ncbi:MAG TPA: TonB-dependent receptor [Stenotrophomonas sp.]|nr:TonB-dependent receptor [Stenotrophomonas sp.]